MYMYVYMCMYVYIMAFFFCAISCTRCFASSYIRRSFVYPHRCTLPSQHAQHFQHLCKCIVLRQIAPC